MTTTSLQEYYAARAPEYDRVYLKPERQDDLRAIERWLPTVFSGKSILEVACGTGYWTQFLAPAAKKIFAIDSSIETLHIAKARIAASHVAFAVGDAYDLPESARGYEAGFAGFWFSHIPRARVEGFLQGFHAALTPGAKVVLLDNRFVNGSNHAIAEQDGEGNTYQIRKLDDGSTHRVLKNFPSKLELQQTVARIAKDVRFHEWPYFWALEYVVA